MPYTLFVHQRAVGGAHFRPIRMRPAQVAIAALRRSSLCVGVSPVPGQLPVPAMARVDGTAMCICVLIYKEVQEIQMNDNQKSTRGLRRGLLYGMIPLGFVILVLVLVFSGLWRQETS